MTNSKLFKLFVLFQVSLALVACSGGSKKPKSPADGLASAEKIPIPCPPGQNTVSYTDGSGLHIVNCTAQK